MGFLVRIYLVDKLLKALFCGGDAYLQVVKHCIVVFHNAVESILNIFRSIARSRYNVSLGGNYPVRKLRRTDLIAAHSGFKSDSKTVYLFKVIVLRHLNVLVSGLSFFGDEIICFTEHQFRTACKLLIIPEACDRLFS